MNKAELIDMVAVDACISKAQATRAIDALTQAITQAMQDSQKVTLPGFAVFLAKPHQARVTAHPRTHQPLLIPAAVKPQARFSEVFKQTL